MELKLDIFEGPLDLLLHLIKENKMDIFDIEVNVITDQYLSYIHSFEKQSLEGASLYLVMASELIELKARMLLPRPVKEVLEEEDDDPRESLVSRLLEYQAYKEISKELKEKEETRKEIHTKLPTYYQEEFPLELGGSLDSLVEAFQKFLARKKEEVPLATKVTMREITVSSRKIEIRKILQKEKRVRFFDLFPVLSTDYMVSTFLAILEMARSQELVIHQEALFQEIVCEVR